jgi:polysaccharide biosynthesis protein PslG
MTHFPLHFLASLFAVVLSVFGFTFSFAAEPPVKPVANYLPGPQVPDGLGVNIHFIDPRPGELEMLAAAGFRWVRMDFSWESSEREKGKYDFSAYDRLLAALEKDHIRAVFILDYANRHYDGGLSPSSDTGRRAMARCAVAAAGHFRGRGILWEMYNEPNIGFWKPKPDVNQYAKLALEVGRALRAAEPGETYIGPAASTIDFAFLEKCFQAGLLEYWSAVSVHPYRQGGPEAAAAEYARLRKLIERYLLPAIGSNETNESKNNRR